MRSLDLGVLLDPDAYLGVAFVGILAPLNLPEHELSDQLLFRELLVVLAQLGIRGNESIQQELPQTLGEMISARNFTFLAATSTNSCNSPIGGRVMALFSSMEASDTAPRRLGQRIGPTDF